MLFLYFRLCIASRIGPSYIAQDRIPSKTGRDELHSGQIVEGELIGFPHMRQMLPPINLLESRQLGQII